MLVTDPIVNKRERMKAHGKHEGNKISFIPSPRTGGLSQHSSSQLEIEDLEKKMLMCIQVRND